MKISHYQDIAETQFEGKAVQGVTGRVAIGKADKAENFCMRVFTIAPGGFTPKHTHDWEHEIFIYAGAGAVFRDGKYQAVTSGTAIFIPAGEEHQLKNQGENDFVFVCLVPSGVPEL